MDEKVTITIQCSANEALLILACHDLIRLANGVAFAEECLTALGTTEFLIDTLGAGLRGVVEVLESKGRHVYAPVRALASHYRRGKHE